MPEYSFHIHGKPFSQDIWKNDEYYDYLSGMYSNTYLNASSDESFLIIEILNSTVHYTYMRSKGVRDSKEREGSFFAMTVSMTGKYCSVIALYNLLDQIFIKIAKPSFFNQDGVNLQYKVIQLEDARIAGVSAVDQIKAAFDKNVLYLDLKKLDNSKDTVRSTETKVFSLMDVDSPEFISEFKNYRIVVSNMVDSAIKRCGKVEADYAAIVNKNSNLTTQNSLLNSQISSLKKENELLSSQLHSSTSSAEKKYKDTIKQLRSEIEIISSERDSLKKIIDEATSSIELIDKPVQKLTRLLAGRFPESDKKHIEEDLESSQKCYSKVTKEIRTSGLNSILLGIIIALCLVIIYFVAFSASSNQDSGNNNTAVEATDSIVEDNGLTEEFFSNETEEVPPTSDLIAEYDDLDKCRIDVDGDLFYDDQKIAYAKAGQTYTLSMVKRIKENGRNKFVSANVQNGVWSVIIDPTQAPINTNNSFEVPADGSGKNVLIKYQTKDGKYKTRPLSIK